MADSRSEICDTFIKDLTKQNILVDNGDNTYTILKENDVFKEMVKQANLPIRDKFNENFRNIVLFLNTRDTISKQELCEMFRKKSSDNSELVSPDNSELVSPLATIADEVLTEVMKTLRQKQADKMAEINNAYTRQLDQLETFGIPVENYRPTQETDTETIANNTETLINIVKKSTLDDNAKALNISELEKIIDLSKPTSVPSDFVIAVVLEIFLSKNKLYLKNIEVRIDNENTLSESPFIKYQELNSNTFEGMIKPQLKKVNGNYSDAFFNTNPSSISADNYLTITEKLLVKDNNLFVNVGLKENVFDLNPFNHFNMFQFQEEKIVINNTNATGLLKKMLGQKMDAIDENMVQLYQRLKEAYENSKSHDFEGTSFVETDVFDTPKEFDDPFGKTDIVDVFKGGKKKTKRRFLKKIKSKSKPRSRSKTNHRKTNKRNRRKTRR